MSGMSPGRCLLVAFLLFSSASQAQAPPSASPNVQGLWWRSPPGSEAGWGLNIAQQGEVLFVTWFTYDSDGTGLWLVMPSGSRVGDNMFGGRLYQAIGPAFDTSAWDPRRVLSTQVGDLLLTFSDANNGVMTYTVNGIGISLNGDTQGGHGNTQTKPITRQVFASPVPECSSTGAVNPSNYQDLWWGAADGSQAGWGVNVTHQGETLFATWFTFGADGRGVWYVMSNGVREGPARYFGNLYRTTGPAFNSKNWDPQLVKAARVGTGTFVFADAVNGTFTYSVDGVSQSKAITRQVFAAPATACR